MTVIEFFDRESAIENIAGTIVSEPEKVVFIGSNAKRMKRSIENYKAVVDARGMNVEFSCVSVSRNDLDAIITALDDVISRNDDCRIDIGGGDELFLVAVGMIYEKYKDKIEIHRFDVNNNMFRDCSADGCVLKSVSVNLGVDDNIRIYGGRVVYNDEKANTTCDWNFTDELKADIRAMWEVCRKNVKLWNSFTNVLARLCNRYLDESSLRMTVARNEISGEPDFLQKLLTELEKCGAIKNLIFGSQVSFAFKNKDSFRCLTKAGLILELTVALTAVELGVYDDVKTGVFIDWDGIVFEDNRADVENEIDVILMDGMVPVFVSCKNGTVDADELYKLAVVAERFGGKYAKKVLVTTRLDELGYKAEYIRLRAKDMGIRIVENFDEMSKKELGDAVAKFRLK